MTQIVITASGNDLTSYLLAQPHDLLSAATLAQSKIGKLRRELKDLGWQLAQQHAILQFALSPTQFDKKELEQRFQCVMDTTRTPASIRHHMRALCRRIDDVEHWNLTFQHVIQEWQTSRGMTPLPDPVPIRENEPHLYTAAQESPTLY